MCFYCHMYVEYMIDNHECEEIRTDSTTFKTALVRLDQVRLNQVRLGEAMLGQVKLDYANIKYIKFKCIFINKTQKCYVF